MRTRDLYLAGAGDGAMSTGARGGVFRRNREGRKDDEIPGKHTENLPCLFAMAVAEMRFLRQGWQTSASQSSVVMGGSMAKHLMGVRAFGKGCRLHLSPLMSHALDESVLVRIPGLVGWV